MVAEALDGLPGVEYSEMKWPETEDLLFVTYDPQQVDPQKMIEVIKKVRFQAEIRNKTLPREDSDE